MYVREGGTGVLRLRNDVVFLEVVCVICERHWGLFFVDSLSPLVYILPQIAQITQRNAASCIIPQRKTGCLRLRLFCGFVSVNQRDLREKWPFTHKERTSEEQAIKQQGLYISTVWNLSLSARSTASALADPFDQPVFRLRNLRNLRENRPFTHAK